MVAEVQQSSNPTYRASTITAASARTAGRANCISMQALAVARREPPKDPRRPDRNRSAPSRAGGFSRCFPCDKFTTETRTVEGEMADSVSPESFVSLLVLAGEGAIRHGGETYPVKKGQKRLPCPRAGRLRADRPHEAASDKGIKG